MSSPTCTPIRRLALVTLLAACAARHPSPSLVATPGAQGGGDDRQRVHALWQQRSREGAGDLCLGPGDLIEISVVHWQDMQNLRARVSPAGTISLPFLGNVQAAGLTETELRDQIAAALRKNMMRDPQVNVFVAEHVSDQVSVTGAVARPGLIGLTRSHRTVADLVSEAGGGTEQAGGKILFYPVEGDTSRCGPNGAQVASNRPRTTVNPPTGLVPIEIDTTEEYDPPQENPLNLPVIGGDSIVINRGRFLVDGWVNKPGAYDIAPGMTAFGGISAAGGAVYAGDTSSVKVWRTLRNGTKKQIDVDVKAITRGEAKDVTLQAGDIVTVPASAIKMVPYGAYWVITNVVRVGASLPLF